jgi:hypothetical protein
MSGGVLIFLFKSLHPVVVHAAQVSRQSWSVINQYFKQTYFKICKLKCQLV